MDSVAATKQEGFYTISAVEDLTGVNKITIRAWETRHGFIKPKRTESGRRLYTQDDIDRIKLALHLKDQGVAISRVKSVIEDSHVEKPESSESGPWEFYRQQMFQAIVEFNDDALDAYYSKALSLFSLDLVTKELMMPVLHVLGERWQSSKGGIAEEHFFSTFMRNKLGARLNFKKNSDKGAPLYVAACLPDEMHELGLLVFALAAQASGCRIILLGANVPVSEIVEVSKRVACDGVVIANSSKEFTQASKSDLTDLCNQVDVPVWVGGNGAVTYQSEILSAGALTVGSDPFVAVEMIKAGMEKYHEFSK